MATILLDGRMMEAAVYGGAVLGGGGGGWIEDGLQIGRLALEVGSRGSSRRTNWRTTTCW